MTRAIFTLGWGEAAVAGRDALPLVPASLTAASSLRSWQKLADRLDIDLSASWLLSRPSRGAPLPADVRAAFRGTEEPATEAGLLRAVRRLRRAAARGPVVTDFDEVARRCAALRRAGRRIVFTNGVFDLLHVGHLRLLERARACGDALVVGVNSDDSARRLKGLRRPVVPQFARAELVAAVRGVDFCAIFDEPDPAEAPARRAARRAGQGLRIHALRRGGQTHGGRVGRNRGIDSSPGGLVLDSDH